MKCTKLDAQERLLSAFRSITGIILLGSLVPLSLFFANGSAAGATQVSLNTASNFAVLAATTVTNTGPTVITGGSLGLTDPAPNSVTGFPPGTLNPPATQYINDSTATTAETDLSTAITSAAAEPTTATISQDLGLYAPLGPGVYASGSSMGLTGTLTLNGQGDPNSVFVFKMPSTLTTATNSQVVLENGAQACNVFWEVGSSATLGGAAAGVTNFVGTVLASTSITANIGVVIAGRLLAHTGAVTLDNNTITTAPCSVPAVTTTTVPATTTTVPTTTTSVPTTTTSVPTTTTVAPLALRRRSTTRTAPSTRALVLGATLSDVATISGPAGAPLPTGSARFYECGPGSTSCSPSQGRPLGARVPVMRGRAISPEFTPKAVGTYCFAVTYAPTGAIYNGSSESGDPADGECVTVSLAGAGPPLATMPPSTPPIKTPPAKTVSAKVPPVKIVPVKTPPAKIVAIKSPPAKTPPMKTPPAQAPTAKSPPVTVPPTHTGEPWSSPLYWLLVGVIGAGGLGLMTHGSRRRRSGRSGTTG